MTTTNTVDAARVELLLSELRLPGIKLMWAKLAEQSDKEGWPAARFLATLAEHEMAERGCRRIERHLVEARLPAGKTLATVALGNYAQNSAAYGCYSDEPDYWRNLRGDGHRLCYRSMFADFIPWWTSNHQYVAVNTLNAADVSKECTHSVGLEPRPRHII